MAHLSDLHLGNGRDDRTATVASYLRGLVPAPDVVVVTGDVADRGAPDDYARAMTLLAGLDPLVVPGNHDDRGALAPHLGLVHDGPLDRVLRRGGVTVALCDSSVPGQPHGRLAPSTLAMLDGLVDEPGPLVVALHHPPLAVGHPFMDAIALADPADLEAVLRRRTGTTLVLCGHVHMAMSTTFAGHPLVIAPGVSSTLRPPEEPGDGLTREPSAPGFAVHVLDPGRPVRTWFRTLP